MTRKRTWLAPLLVVLALGFALRITDLDGQSMWSDEGLSLYRAQQPLAALFANQIVVDGISSTDTNPPGYFLLLHAWRALVGESVFVLRFVGAIVAALAVPLAYVTGRLLGGRRLGFVAALLLALSPFHVWQSQVLRNYGVLLTLNLASVYALFRFICAARRRRWLALWLVFGLAGIYTHFFGFFVFAFGLLALGVALLAGEGRRLLRSRWLWLALAAGILLALPVIPLAIDRFRAGQQIDFTRVPVLDIAHHALGTYGVGVSPIVVHAWWRWLPAAVLAAMGAFVAWRRSRTGFWLLVGYQVVPLGLLVLLSVFNPLYNGVRHLLIGLPPFLLFAGWGMVGGRGLWRRVGLSLGVLVLAIQTGWLWNQFHAPELVRDDVRGAATYLNEQAAPDDIIILHDTLISFTFNAYYEGAAPVVSVPRFGETDEAAALARLQEVAGGANRVWFLVNPLPRTGFNRSLLTRWARTNWLEIDAQSFSWMWLPVHLQAFTASPSLSELPSEAAPIAAEWPGVLRLHGYELPGELASGDTWWPTFYLEQDGADDRQYALTLRLEAGGKTWGSSEHALGGALRPVGSWPADTIVRAFAALPLPGGLPEGRYQLWLSLVETETSRLIPLADGAVELALGEYHVMAAPCDTDGTSGRGRQPAPVAFGDAFELAGYDLPRVDYRPGHLLGVDLLWCRREEPDEPLAIRLQVVDRAGNVVAENRSNLDMPGAPLAPWSTGQLLRLHPELAIPATLEPGSYRVRLAVVEAADDRPVWIYRPWPVRALALGAVDVVAWPLQTELPPVGQGLEASFGESPLVELTGYDLDERTWRAGDVVPLTLVWRSLSDLSEHWDVLVHLIDDQGEIVAQGDGPPVGGFRPTASWRAGEVLVDERQLILPADLAPGSYTLWTGLYRPGSWERLPAFVAGERQPEDRILLGTLVVEAPND